MLTFDAILAMDRTTLNQAIEQHCTTHHWVPLIISHRQVWQLRADDIQGVLHSSVPYVHWTENWDRTMRLSRRWGVWSVPCYQPNLPYQRDPAYQARWRVCCYDRGIEVTSEAEERLVRCQLALWRAMVEQQEETDGHA